MRRFALASVLLLICGMAGVGEVAAQADFPDVLGTPDGQPPAMEDICDLTSGAAHGLCTAYCEAMDCDSETPSANEQACTKMRDKFVNITGEQPPCERVCPCWDPEDLNSVTAANQLDVGSCDAIFPNYPNVIQNDFGSPPGVEGGFAADPTFLGEPSCQTRDFPPYLLFITLEESDVCIDQIRARCAAIGTPIP